MSVDDRPYQPPKETNPLGIVSFALGLVSFPAACCCGILGVPVPVVGLILGIVGVMDTRKERVFGIIGIVLNAVALTLGVAVIVLAVLGQSGQFDQLLQQINQRK